ncbi:MAG TPA: M20/M25/M40 family metallo-hydrolase [Ktedonobacterales bacterium]|nr:M20/M25/M40 family metallo-hydrolase [Ktedonobacterales bacterium]
MPAPIPANLDRLATDARLLLEQLCRQPSIAAQNTGIAEMADLVEAEMRETGFTTRRFSIPGAPPILYGELKGGPYTVLLYDHYDVQPPEPLDLWESPAFEPTVRDGKLYARGTSDDKGEIATRLIAIRALREELGQLPITLKYIIEGEEEIGSPHFEAIIKPHAKLLKADGCLWEGDGFEPDGRPELGLGSKGLLYVQLDVQGTGKDAHSGGAPVLPSAAWRLVQALATLKTPKGHIRIPGFYDDVRPPTEAQLQALRDQPDTDEYMKESFQLDRFIDDLAGFELRKRQAFAPTCNIAGLTSGYGGEGSKTVLPAHAMAKIDFRLVPDQDPNDILAKLKVHLTANGYDDVRVTVFGNAEPVVTPIEEPFVQRIARIARAFGDQQPSITPLFGGTLPLLGALRRHVGVPGLSVPGDPVYWANGAHSPNEHVRLEDLRRAVHFNWYLFQELGKK